MQFSIRLGLADMGAVVDHAFLAPSSAHIRQACPAAARMLASYPKPDSEESQLGTAAHEVAFYMLEAQSLSPLHDAGSMLAIASNGVPVDDEMVEAAEVYYSDVINIVPDLQGLHLEARIECPSINDQTWGTPDCWYLSQRGNGRRWTLTIWDYKYGHRYVDVFENWQLIEYAAGILDALNITGLDDTELWVDMRVVQPRCFVGGSPVRNWLVRASDLRGYFNEARAFEERSLDPNSRARSNPNCRDCVPGMCSAAQAAGYNAIDVSLDPQPFALPPEALSLELRKLRRAKQAIEARTVGLEEQAVAFIRGGTLVPGFALQSSQGSLKWNVEEEQVFITGEMLDVELSKRKAITPTQAIKAGLPKELVETMAFRPTGELKLVEDDGATARKVFRTIDG